MKQVVGAWLNSVLVEAIRLSSDSDQMNNRSSIACCCSGRSFGFGSCSQVLDQDPGIHSIRSSQYNLFGLGGVGISDLASVEEDMEVVRAAQLKDSDAFGVAGKRKIENIEKSNTGIDKGSLNPVMPIENLSKRGCLVLQDEYRKHWWKIGIAAH